MGEKQKQRNETNAVALPMASAQSLGEFAFSYYHPIIVGCSSSPLSLNADKKPLISFICFLVAHGTAAVSTILLIAFGNWSPWLRDPLHAASRVWRVDLTSRERAEVRKRFLDVTTGQTLFDSRAENHRNS